MEDFIVRRYLHGKCFAFAVALHRRIKKPFYGLFNEAGELHHVFLADPKTGKAYDIRGVLPLQDISNGSAAETNSTTRPVSRLEVEEVYGLPSRTDIIEAGKIVDRFRRKWSI